MYVKIPFTGNSPRYQTLRSAIACAASETGIDQFRAVLLLSAFFEAVAGSLSQGDPVAVPGFGLFCPSLVERKNRAPKAYAAFAASRGLANQIKIECPEAKARAGRDLIRAHRKSHHPTNRKEKVQARAFTTQQALRTRVRAQARRLAIDLPG